VATRLAAFTVLTNDNPRSEDPLAIIEEIRGGIAGTSGYAVELDRAQAITGALSRAQPGDVVLIAGKGHEAGQEQDGRVAPFDDRAAARQALAALARDGASW
jgi:UDP-N-acetylmuramoyl-L-alanyl-D-glutamate--2,6-diaminopimelate ligase